MPRWDLFAGVAVLLAVVTLGLARATQGALGGPGGAETDMRGGPADASPERRGEPADTSPRRRSGPADPAPDRLDDPADAGSGRLEDSADAGPDLPDDPAGGPPDRGTPAALRSSARPLDARLLFANVALSHGLLGSLLAASAWYAGIPAGALGVDGGARAALLPGAGLGIALYAANEAASRIAEGSGIEYDDRLRELLAPGSAGGWVVLFAAVLPLVAVVEELLFRAALIGALSAGYGLPAWGLAAASSALFGLGHGLQGPAGVIATAALGFVLAAAFVLTGNLWIAIVAHYLVNALEFAVHEL